MKKKWVLLGFSVIMVLLLGLVGCQAEDSDAVEGETTLERATRQGYIRVGFANEAPFAYATETGELTGQNVEIARAILKNLGIDEMDGVLTEFGSLIPGLQANRFDMITAGMYITTDRAKEVTFANPEYQIGGGLAVAAGNPYNLKSYWDIADNPDVKVAVMAGGLEYDHLIACGVSEDQIETVSDQPSAVDALLTGRVNAFTATSMAVRTYVELAGDPGIEYVEDFEIATVDGSTQAGFGSSAFRHEDADFVEAYNRELEKLKESGELLEIQKRFGFTEAEYPGDAVVQDAFDAGW